MLCPPLFVESYSYTPFSDKAISSNPDRSDEGVIEQSTYLLLNDTNAGEWGEADFRRAEAIIEGWSLRQSKRAALAVERLLRRIVREQEAENPYADCVDMTALYTNLVEGWAKCGEPGGAERAEEILDYFQRVYEDGDSYDPLLCGPGLESFNAVISAYARRRTDDAPQQAVRVLGKLYEWNGDGRTIVMPNKETYACTYASRILRRRMLRKSEAHGLMIFSIFFPLQMSCELMQSSPLRMPQSLFETY